MGCAPARLGLDTVEVRSGGLLLVGSWGFPTFVIWVQQEGVPWSF